MTIIKVLVLILIVFVGIYGTYVQFEEGNYGRIIWIVLGMIAVGVLTALVTDWIMPILPYPDSSITASAPVDDTKGTNFLPTQTDAEEDDLGESQQETDNMNHLAGPAESTKPNNTTSTTTTTNTGNTGGTGTASPPEDNKPTYAGDILGTQVISGRLAQENQKDEYVCAAPTEGTYHFSADLSSGGEVVIRLCDENRKSLNSGTNTLTIDLTTEKTYILSIEYRNAPCDYTINVGVPGAVTDITGKTSVAGKITYQDQKDRYRYTASIGGTYRFDTNLSSAGEVRVRISGENGKSINYASNALTIDLEAGKTYILSIEYRNGPCDYTLQIGTPIAISDITGSTSISGSIAYQDQNNQYRYTAAVSGTYRFDTNLSSAGEVRVRISGENGKSINYASNALTIDLEAGKTYILSIEYRNGPCDYTVQIGVPMPVIDISGSTAIVGKIAFQDQKDRYYYTAPTSGTYRFDSNLSAGGEVRIRISGESGNSINYASNALTIDLEAGKTYLLSVEYRNGPCDYAIAIGVPNPVTDITGYNSISGNITYQDQKDRYYYTAPLSGSYRFSANLSAGGEVRIRISGENGNSLNYGTNTLTMNLEEGKTYLLSVEYRNSSCSYSVLIEPQ